MQKLVNLNPANGAGRGGSPSAAKMHLAALVIPGVASLVCVIVGLLTLHEYCLDGGGFAAHAASPSYSSSSSSSSSSSVASSQHQSSAGSPKCFFPSALERHAILDPALGLDVARDASALGFAKVSAISFYAASLLTTAASGLTRSNRGPLARSLVLYHALICFWSVGYYVADFFGYVPLIRSAGDGAVEYSAMRVLVVWPVTSTLMISKIAALRMMTAQDNPAEDPFSREEDADDDEMERERGREAGARDANGVDANERGGTRGARRRVASGASAGSSYVADASRVLAPLRSLSARLDRLMNAGAGIPSNVLSASWDVWGVSLVNNLMLLAGAFGLISARPWARFASMFASCVLFVALMLGFALLFTHIVERAVHPRDKRQLWVLESLTYVTWTLFPIIQLLRESGAVNTAQQFLLMTFADVVAKMLYSTVLIFGNFWLINAADGLMRLDEGLFTDALELSRCSQLAAATLEAAKHEAENVSALHRAFVANISHELRTPLNSIIAFNSLLMEDESLTEPQREFVSSAIVSAEALLGIIGQILDFAKLESGIEQHQELVVESFDVNDVMNELVDIVGHQANKNQVELVLDIDPLLDGVFVRGDKFRLRQALINVTNNSIKYTREGGEVRLTVNVEGADDVRDAVVHADGRGGGDREHSFPDHPSPSLRLRRTTGGGGGAGAGAGGAGALLPSSSPGSRGAFDSRRTVTRQTSWLAGLSIETDRSDRNDGVRGGGGGGDGALDRAAGPATRGRAAAARGGGVGSTPAFARGSSGSRRVTVQFRVEDTGIGISEDKLGVVFLPFGQASASSTREYGGTGLGLAITSNIVRALGGSVSCESAVGVGTTMTLAIPFEVPGLRASFGPSNARRKGLLAEPSPFRLVATDRVVSVVANDALGAAIGRAANAGGARHENLGEFARRFPHTEHQRRWWGRELAERVVRARADGGVCLTLVLEECFLAPVAAEWRRVAKTKMPPIVLIVAKKRAGFPFGFPASAFGRETTPAPGDAAAGPSSFAAAAGPSTPRPGTARGAAAAAHLAPRPAHSLANTTETGTNSDASPFLPGVADVAEILHGVAQVVRPVKPTSLRDAMRAADAALDAAADEQRDEGGGEDGGGGGGGGGGGAAVGVGGDDPRRLETDADAAAAAEAEARAKAATRWPRQSAVDDGRGGRLPRNQNQNQNQSGGGGFGRARARSRLARASTRGDEEEEEEDEDDEPPRRVPPAAPAPLVARRVTRSAARRASPAELTELPPNGPEAPSEPVAVARPAGAGAASPSRSASGAPRPSASAPPDPAFVDGGRVLIVEDNAMNQKVAVVVVKHCGMSATVANNGREALDTLLSGARFDIILMDIQMPVMDGLDATRAIRDAERRGAIPERNYIVAVSANAAAEDHQAGYGAGMDEYITKPIYPARLKELLTLPRRAMGRGPLEDRAERDGEVTSDAGPARRGGRG